MVGSLSGSCCGVVVIGVVAGERNSKMNSGRDNVLKASLISCGYWIEKEITY